MKDLISRQAAVDRAVSIPMFGRDVKMVAVSEIKNLPSAQPETEERTAESAQNVPNDELISKKAAIDAVQNAFDKETILNSFVRKVAIDALKALSSVQPQSKREWYQKGYEAGQKSVQPQRWIPVTEALPEKKTEVIYSLENRFVSTGYMTDRDYKGDEIELHWEDMESGALIYPEAWMPLPPSYKGGQDD